MTFVLTETSAGYALFKAKDKKLYKSDSILSDLASPSQVADQFKIKAFEKFESAADALGEINSVIDAKVSDKLKQILSELKEEKKATLVVSDPKLGTAINKLPELSLKIVSDSNTLDILRAIREHLPSVLPGLQEKDISTMALGLAHSIGRHKLKFSPDKVDVMIIQAIALLDDLDKEVNVYAMRLKEWYGWHFPEMTKIITDNLAYAEVIKIMGLRSNAVNTDFSSILPEDLEQRLKDAAEISMGTEIVEEDLKNIDFFAEQVIKLSKYRERLSSYLNNRMAVIAPNLTSLVGELVGARLIAHSGSIINLAKAPASTIQILGAEKALFRALKTKHDTPKYGILYHASLVGQASGKNKGKIARMLAAKSAVSTRYDALAEERSDEATIGVDDRLKIERRLAALEGKDISRVRSNVHSQPKSDFKPTTQYNAAADAPDSDDEDDDDSMKADTSVTDVASDSKKRKRDSDEDSAAAKAARKAEKKAKKEEKKAKKEKKEKKEKK